MKQVAAAGAVFAILILVVILMMMGNRDDIAVQEDEHVQETASVGLDSSDDGGGAGADAADENISEPDDDGIVRDQDGEDDFVPLPSFDIIRVEGNGDAVVAGQAEVGSTVTVMTHDSQLAEALTNDAGEWVVVLEQPLAPGDHELWITARSEDGKRLESNESVVMSVPDLTGSETAVAAATEESDESGGYSQGNAGSSSGDDGGLALSQNGDAESLTESNVAHTDGDPVAVSEGDEILAIVVPRDGEGDVEVMQAPRDGIGISGGGDLTLDSLTYDTEGSVTLSGQAKPDAIVVPYVDGEALGQGQADTEGSWQVTLDRTLEEGQYDLRVDQVDESGTVSARLETPFQQAAFTMPTTSEPLVVIQPGNNLWLIARRIYGEGTLYTQIFEANSSQIADPDLIYPGQIFVLPASDESGG